MQRVFMFLFAAGLTLTAHQVWPQTPAPAQPEGSSGWTPKQAVAAERFMVAAAHPLAAETGRDVLASGGNAIDAMVAVQLVLNLVEPQSSGIGGGAFLVFWDAEAGELTTFDGRETAPAAAGPDYFLKPDGTPVDFWQAVVGGRSVGVPGTLELLETVHGRYGVKPWAELVRPAIDLAEQGFEVSPRLAAAIAEADEHELSAFAEARELFFDEAGAPLRAGAVLRNPAFAESLRRIAAEGSAPFYQGAIGQAIVDAVRQAPVSPGELTMADLAAYTVEERAPVCIGYRGRDVCGMGPPSSGGLTVGQILGLLEHFDLPGMAPDEPLAWHLFAEASKLAYADRDRYMADADFVNVPTTGLFDPAYLTARAQAIAFDRAMPPAEAGNPPWRRPQPLAPALDRERPGTSHFVIVDEAGNAVSMTTTIETGFGSRVMAGGFLLNNEMTDFAFEPVIGGRPVANRVQPGKRPRSSMAPTIVLEDDRPLLLIGSPGGSRIIPYVAQALVGVLDWGLDPQAAIDLGHVVNRNDATTELEAGTPIAGLADGLGALGHQIEVVETNSGLHGILRQGDRLIGGADPRREGVALGE